MITDLNAFREKVQADKDLQAKIQEITKASTEETVIDNYIAFAAEQGYTITKEDFKTASENYKVALSDEDLDNVSGGIFTPTIASLISMAVLTFVTTVDVNA